MEDIELKLNSAKKAIEQSRTMIDKLACDDTDYKAICKNTSLDEATRKNAAKLLSLVRLARGIRNEWDNTLFNAVYMSEQE